MAQRELAGDGQADDSRADDDEVALAGRLIGRHAARYYYTRSCGPSDEAPGQAPAGALAQAAAHGRGVGLRAQVRRLSRPRLRRRQGSLPPVANRAAPGPLLPGARVPGRQLRDRWRAGDPRHRRARGVRRASEPPAPGRVARADARREDPGPVPGVRPARPGRRPAAGRAVRRPPRGARGARRRAARRSGGASCRRRARSR